MNAMTAAIEAEAEAPPPIGHNAPPEPTPFDDVKTHIDDLLLEARNWADGQKVETQEQADAVSRLIEDLRLAVQAADDKRKEEKAPLDKQIAEIQERYNTLIADNKTQTGTAVLGMAALKATLKVFLDAEDAKRLKAAEEARVAAQEAADLAAAAFRAADVTDLGAREEAEDLLNTAKQAAATVRHVEAARPQGRGGSRAMGLRKTYTPKLVNAAEALTHYRQTCPDDLKAWLLSMAAQDFRAGKRTIPGVECVEGTAL